MGQIFLDAAGQIDYISGVFYDITARKQTEEALRRSEQRKTILNRIANAFLTVSDDEIYAEVLAVILQVMKSKFGVFGFIGANGDLVIPSMTRDVWRECQVPDKSIIFPPATWGDSLWGKAIREKKAFSSDGPFHTPDGHIPIEHFLTVPIVFGNVTVGLISVANSEQSYSEEDQDLLESIANHIAPILNARLQRDWQERERRRSEAEVVQLSRRMELILNSAGEGIFGTDTAGKVTFVNPAMAQMLGWEIAELLGQPIHDLCHHTRPDGRPLPSSECPIHLAFKKGRIYHADDEFFWRKDGTSLPVEYTSTPIREGDQVVGTVVVIKDITERRQAEEAKLKLEAQLRQAQKMEAIGTLAGGIAHDFNNILSAIIGYGEMIQMFHTPVDAEAKRDVDEILRAAFRAKDLVQQILTFSRRAEQDRKPIQLQIIIKESLKFLRASLPSTIEIRQSLDPEVAPVLADPTQMQQVMMNLCTNAAHAMRQKGGVLEIRLTEMVVGEEKGDETLKLAPGPYARLTVKDTGHGIPQKMLERIFDPYFTTKGMGEGTGLGLAVVEGIVHSHGGAITVESEPGVGTTFHVFIPLVERSEITLPTETPNLIPRGQGRVLFVDDESALAHLGQEILENLGYEVETLTSSAAALERFHKHPQGYDLAILDLTMPLMTGLELARELLKIRPDLPIILSSGFADKIHQEELRQMSIRQVLIKPWSVRVLAETIKKALA